MRYLLIIVLALSITGCTTTQPQPALKVYAAADYYVPEITLMSAPDFGDVTDAYKSQYPECQSVPYKPFCNKDRVDDCRPSECVEKFYNTMIKSCGDVMTVREYEESGATIVGVYGGCVRRL